MTIEDLRAKWVGRMIYGSADSPKINPALCRPRKIETINENQADGMVYAFSGEHHRANSAEALNRRLHMLAV